MPTDHAGNRDDFFDAVRDGDIERMTGLLKDDPSLVSATEEGDPPLYIAGMYGYSGRGQRFKSVVDFLIESGAAVDIFAAAYLDKPDAASGLLSLDGDLATERDLKGQTALHHAAERGSDRVARLLIEHGADANAEDSMGRAPLHNAAHAGPWKRTEAMGVIALLKEHGAHMDIWLAGTLGDTAVIRETLEADPALVNATDDSGVAPLFYAARNLRTEAVTTLLAYGADVTPALPIGQTPLSTAVLHSWDVGGPETVQILLDAGATPTFMDSVCIGQTDRVRAALENDASLAEGDPDSLTPLHAAIQWNRGDIVDLLIGHGADVNADEGSGEKPLATARRHTNERLAAVLIQHGATD